MNHLGWAKAAAAERERLAEMWTRDVLVRFGGYRIATVAKSKNFAKVFVPFKVETAKNRVTVTFWANTTVVGMVRPQDHVH